MDHYPAASIIVQVHQGSNNKENCVHISARRAASDKMAVSDIPTYNLSKQKFYNPVKGKTQTVRAFSTTFSFTESMISKIFKNHMKLLGNCSL